MILLSAAAGFFGVTGYLILSVIRRIIGRNSFVCFVEDCILAFIYAVAAYYFMYRVGGGTVIGYNYVFLVLGALIAYRLWGSVKWQSKE